jgi:hypothetical protein
MPDGFDADGQPVGRPVPSPLVQIAGVSEDQAGNVYELLGRMAADDALYGALPDLDVGQTRVNIGHQTVIRPVSSSAGAREGQRVTFGVLEETQHWNRANRGEHLANVMFRNIRKMTSMTMGLAVELSNAPEPGMGSVAERTILGVQKGIDKQVLLDYKQASRAWNWDDDDELLEHLKEVYGDTSKDLGGWVDLKVIRSGVRDSATNIAEGKRYYGNIMAAGQGVWIDPRKWTDRTAPGQGPLALLPPKPMIGIGFDGSRSNDSTVLRGCLIADHRGNIVPAHLFTIGIWEHPPHDDPDNPWQVPQHEVKAAVRQVMVDFDVIRAYGDPPHWRDELTEWCGEWPDIWAEWSTARDAPMAAALERLHTDILEGHVTHDGDSRVALHYGNVYRNVKGQAEKPLVLVKKESPTSMRKIDAVVTDALALEARADAIEAGLPERFDDDHFMAYDDDLVEM